MRYCVYVPLLVCGLLAAARVSPGAGAWMLTGVGLAAAVSSGWTSLLPPATLFDDVPWRPDRLRLLDPVPALVAVAAAAVLGGGGYRLTRSSWLAAATIRRLRRPCRESTPADNLVVADRERPHAVAVRGCGTRRPADAAASAAAAQRGYRTSRTVSVTLLVAGLLLALAAAAPGNACSSGGPVEPGPPRRVRPGAQPLTGRLPLSSKLTLILRGLARSDTGIRSRSTPLS
ncbi:hypothetical protein Dvina_23655 [Dactylosporangium vinaceum]|uniref:Uncharacterized protein n=1 Tax=Dactylosporangium vinaceum TaxID=53362 RepID=A0ABV5MD02_9ACTN|nr:hypothetical protein [Dactylosporangium vinaceum]UAC00781.1 hypothetical protein Dvina_23655 [Dactylosporangium vinaceum]